MLSVTGRAFPSEYVKLNSMEFIPTDITIESLAEALPIQREEIPAVKGRPGVPRSGLDNRLDYRWIDLRTEANQLLFKAQTVLTNAMREYLLAQNFMETHTPKPIAAASES